MHRFSLRVLHDFHAQAQRPLSFGGRVKCRAQRLFAALFPDFHTHGVLSLTSELPDSASGEQQAFLKEVRALVDDVNQHLKQADAKVVLDLCMGHEPLLADSFSLHVRCRYGLSPRPEERKLLSNQLLRLAPLLQFQEPVTA